VADRNLFDDQRLYRVLLIKARQQQRALLSVELSLVQAKADQLNALAALYKAMGGGWIT
jgi:outer membrane protein TolC